MNISDKLKEAKTECNEIFGQDFAEKHPDLVFKYLELDLKQDELFIQADVLYGNNEGCPEDEMCDDCKAELEAEEARKTKLS